MSGTALLAGYLADLATGDPARWHPVAGFGRLAGATERVAYAPSRLRGAVATVALVAGAAAAAELVARRISRRATLVAGVVAYRAANTLDAMFGHRDARYHAFGWSAARLDDVMSWPAARLSAALTCVVAPLVGGSPAQTLTTIRRDGSSHPSPNAGRVEAAFAGALGVRLGGPVAYKGAAEVRPYLGHRRAVEPGDTERAARLSLAVGTAAALLAAVVRR